MFLFSFLVYYLFCTTVCKCENNTETILRNNLFANYDAKNRPVINYTHTVLSSYGIEVKSLEEFDQVGEKVKNFYITIQM